VVAVDFVILCPTEIVGSLIIEAVIDVQIEYANNRVIGKIRIETLRLDDRGGRLGLEREVLDNLGKLGKGLAEGTLNDALRDGIPLTLPSTLFSVTNLQIRLYDRFFYVAADFSISPSLIQQMTSSLTSSLGGSGRCVYSRPCC